MIVAASRWCGSVLTWLGDALGDAWRKVGVRTCGGGGTWAGRLLGCPRISDSRGGTNPSVAVADGDVMSVMYGDSHPVWNLRNSVLVVGCISIVSTWRFDSVHLSRL